MRSFQQVIKFEVKMNCFVRNSIIINNDDLKATWFGMNIFTKQNQTKSGCEDLKIFFHKILWSLHLNIRVIKLRIKI